MIRTATGDRVRARMSREELTRGELRPAAEQGPIPPHLLPGGERPGQAVASDAPAQPVRH